MAYVNQTRLWLITKEITKEKAQSLAPSANLTEYNKFALLPIETLVKYKENKKWNINNLVSRLFYNARRNRNKHTAISIGWSKVLVCWFEGSRVFEERIAKEEIYVGAGFSKPI